MSETVRLVWVMRWERAIIWMSVRRLVSSVAMRRRADSWRRTRSSMDLWSSVRMAAWWRSTCASSLVCSSIMAWRTCSSSKTWRDMVCFADQFPRDGAGEFARRPLGHGIDQVLVEHWREGLAASAAFEEVGFEWAVAHLAEERAVEGLGDPLAGGGGDLVLLGLGGIALPRDVVESVQRQQRRGRGVERLERPMRVAFEVGDVVQRGEGTEVRLG